MKSIKNKKSRTGIHKFIYELKITNSKNKTQHREKVIKIFEKFKIHYINEICKKTINILQTKNVKLIESINKKKFFIIVTTNPYQNHPFILYGDYADDEFKILIPLGHKVGQIDIKKIKKLLKHMNSFDKLALFHLLDNTLEIREKNIFVYTEILRNTPSSLFYCNNIIVCKDTIGKIQNMNIEYIDKIRLSDSIYSKIKNIIVKHLTRYFELLKDNKYTEAREYLVFNFKKIYYDTKELTGHLFIFIEIYKLIDELKKSFR